MSEIPWNSICHRVFLIYLRLSRNQGQEWSPVTISSLAKIIVGVNRMVVENVEIEYPEINPTLIISVRPTKKDSCRCGICGKKCSGYDKGNGKRRWRSLDIGNSYRVYLESDSPRVWCQRTRRGGADGSVGAARIKAYPKLWGWFNPHLLWMPQK